MSEGIYNKTGSMAHGTLVGNWQEERELKDFTGTARTIAKQHIPKKHLDFDSDIAKDYAGDITHDRIYGQRQDAIMKSENNGYGRSYNRADALPTKGKKTAIIEREIEQQVMEELRQKEENEERIRNMRYFDSTAKTTYTKQDYSANVVGKRVMKTQNGQSLMTEPKDEELTVEHGFGRRTQKTTDEELKRQIPEGDFSQTQPVTVYTEALRTKAVMISASTGPNPFAKTSGFTQPVQNTRATKKFEGNVDFAGEKKTTDFNRTHTDLNPKNYQKPDITIDRENFENIKGRIIGLCRERSGNGIRGLKLMFKAIDRDRNNSVDPTEFKYAMRDYGIPISDDEVSAVVKYFDTNMDGKISFDEFLRAVRGDLNDRRTEMVHLAYHVLDRSGDGLVTIADIMEIYDASFHPDFASGRKTKEEVLREFMTIWETHKKDGIVTMAEFEDYYKDVSASIDSDDYFELMIRNAWHIDGGEGQMENTTIKRVLKTNADGSQEVVKVEDDLKKTDFGRTSYGRVDL
jgi:Ca2+-binding EF-hand superfamily protein